MDSTHEVVKKIQRTFLSPTEINTLLFNLYDIKEILYFSICRPDVFSLWVQDYTQPEESEILKEFAKVFLEKFLPGFNFDEALLIQKQQEIYTERKILGKLRSELNAFLNEPDALKENSPEFKKEIIILCNSLEQLFIDRDDYLKSAELAMSAEYLYGLCQYQKEISKQHALIQDAIENYQATSKKSVPEKLLQLFQVIKLRFISLSINQREVEKQISEKRKALDFQAGIIILMLENRVDKLAAFFKKNPKMAIFLETNLNFLRPIQNKFQEYLVKHLDLVPQMLSRDELNEWSKYKVDAAKKYQENIDQDNKQMKARLFEQERSLLIHHEYANQYYRENKLTEALNLYLKGAKDFHPEHLYSAGEMILKGVACQAHALSACHFFRAVAILANHPDQRIAGLEKLKTAYRKALSEPGLSWDENASEIHQQIHHTVLVLQEVDKKIKASHGDLAKKFFNAAEAYLAQYKIELIYSPPKSDEASLCLQQVCHYFGEAYDFVKRLYQNCFTVHENFVLYAKRNGIDLDQIDEINLETSEEETKNICYRFREVEKNVEEAKQQLEELLDQVSRKLSPVYFFIENKQEKSLLDELCIKLEIDVGQVHLGRSKLRNTQ